MKLTGLLFALYVAGVIWATAGASPADVVPDACYLTGSYEDGSRTVSCPLTGQTWAFDPDTGDWYEVGD